MSTQIDVGELRVRGRMASVVSQTVLPVARLAYAGLVGVAMLIATFAIDSSATGLYVYLVGFASVVASVCGFGLDRLVARRVAAGELGKLFPVDLLRLRVAEGFVLTALLLAGALLFGGGRFTLDMAASCVVFAVSRIFYQDIESFWIAARRNEFGLGGAVFLNGAITAAGICGGAAIGSATLMLVGTAIGNAVALALLFPYGRLSRDALANVWSEVRGTAGSLVVAAVYSRVDLLILALLGLSLEDVAIYGLILRVFDALLIIRGALSQQEARDVASLDLESRRSVVARYGVKVCLAACALSVTGLAAIAVLRATLDMPDFQWALVACAALAVPLFISHQTTSVMILADRRNDLLLLGSLVTCLLCVVVKFLLIRSHGVIGAVLAIGTVEWVSCLVFSLIYFGHRKKLILAAAVTPLMALAISIISFVVCETLLKAGV